MVDYSNLSDDDLKALYNNDYSHISDEGLKQLYKQQSDTPEMENIQLNADGSINKPLVGGVEENIYKKSWKDAQKDINENPREALKNMQKNASNPFIDNAKGYVQGFSKLGVGLGKNVGNKVLRPLIGKQPLSDEELDKAYGFLDDKPKGIGKVTSFVGETLPYLMLPEANVVQGGAGAKLANSAITGAYQGGLIGGLESLKNKGLSKDNITDTLGMGTLGAVIPVSLQQGGTAIRKGIENPKFQNGVAKVLEVLTSVPEKFSKLALKKELNNRTLFPRRSKFDVDKAYRPIERKLKEAKSKVPNKDFYTQKYKELGEQARQNFESHRIPESILDQEYNRMGQELVKNVENYKTELAGDVNSAINNLGSDANRFPTNALKNDITSTFDQYGGDLINPARNSTGKLEESLLDLVDSGRPVVNINTNELPQFTGDKNAYNRALRDLYKENVQGDIIVHPELDKPINFYKNGAGETIRHNGQDFDQLSMLPQINEVTKKSKLKGKEPLKPNSTNRYKAEDFKVFRGRANIDGKIVDTDIKVANTPNGNVFYINEKPTQNAGYLPPNGEPVDFGRANNIITNYDEYFNSISPLDLQKIKEQIGKSVNWQDEAARGYKNPILEQIYGKYNNRLNELSPELASANEAYSKLINLEKNVGGLDNRTIADKLRDYQSSGQLRNGRSRALDELDEFLPESAKFVKDVDYLNNLRAVQDHMQDDLGNAIFKDISRYENAPIPTQEAFKKVAKNQYDEYLKVLEQQKTDDELLKMIGGRQYERNPRLLGNRTDEGFENALINLQNRSGVNFMNDLEVIRAREALENLLPGQGGGSGSLQGFGNLVRSAIIGGSPTTALVTQNPFALSGLLAVSPKYMGQGTIKNLGQLYKLTGKEPPNWLIKALFGIGAGTIE